MQRVVDNKHHDEEVEFEDGSSKSSPLSHPIKPSQPSRQHQEDHVVAEQQPVMKIEHAEDTPDAIDRWIQSVEAIHKNQPSASVQFEKRYNPSDCFHHSECPISTL